MPPTQETSSLEGSPIVSALRKLSASAACHSEATSATVRITSYRTDFDYLWNLAQADGESLMKWICPQGDGEQPNRILVLVWDGIPDQTWRVGRAPALAVEKRSTAYDWATALIQTLSYLAGKNTFARLRLLIVDVASFRYSEAFGVQAFPPAAEDSPWIKIFRPFHAAASEESTKAAMDNAFPKGTAAKYVSEIHPGFLRLIEEFRSAEKDTGRLGFSTPEALEFRNLAELLKSLWVADLTRADGRHEISNVVGPLILEHALNPDNNRNPSAIIGLLRALNLLHQRNRPGDGATCVNPMSHSIVEDDLFEQFHRLRILLIDDHADYGFGSFFAQFLDFPQPQPRSQHVEANGRSLSWLNSPQSLIEHLNDQIDDNQSPLEQIEEACDCGGKGKVHPLDRDEPRLLGVQSERFPANGFDVLILDLRLFGAGDSRSEEAEKGFVQSLLDIYHKTGWCRSGTKPLSAAAQSARAFLHPYGNSSKNLDYLTLLPLLITAFDPSLPIVIFSSSRQQAISSLISHCPNIVISFGKPSITGYDDDTPYLENLRSSIVSAFRRHEMRVVWKAIVSLYNSVDTRLPSTALGHLNSSRNYTSKQFQVDRAAICLLANEYFNVLLSEKYADALQVPGNWIELHNLLPTTVKEGLLEICKFGMLVSRGIQGLSISTLESYFEMKHRLSKPSAIADQLSQLLRKFGTVPDLNLADNHATLEFLSTSNLVGPVRRNLDDIGFTATLSKPMGDDRVLQELQAFLQERAEAEVANTIVNVLHGVRNLRAHYRVRPEHHEASRTAALWLWLWLIEGLFPQARPALQASTAHPDRLLHHWYALGGNEEFTDFGLDALDKEMRIKLGPILRKEILEIRDQRLRKPFATLLDSIRETPDKGIHVHRCEIHVGDVRTLVLKHEYSAVDQQIDLSEVRVALGSMGVMEVDFIGGDSNVVLTFCCNSIKDKFRNATRISGKKSKGWVVVPGAVLALLESDDKPPSSPKEGKEAPSRNSSAVPGPGDMQTSKGRRKGGQDKQRYRPAPSRQGSQLSFPAVISRVEGRQITVLMENGIMVSCSVDGPRAKNMKPGTSVTLRKIGNDYRL